MFKEYKHDDAAAANQEAPGQRARDQREEEPGVLPLSAMDYVEFLSRDNKRERVRTVLKDLVDPVLRQGFGEQVAPLITLLQSLVYISSEPRALHTTSADISIEGRLTPTNDLDPVALSVQQEIAASMLEYCFSSTAQLRRFLEARQECVRQLGVESVRHLERELGVWSDGIEAGTGAFASAYEQTRLERGFAHPDLLPAHSAREVDSASFLGKHQDDVRQLWKYCFAESSRLNTAGETAVEKIRHLLRVAVPSERVPAFDIQIAPLAEPLPPEAAFKVTLSPWNENFLIPHIVLSPGAVADLSSKSKNLLEPLVQEVQRLLRKEGGR